MVPRHSRWAFQRPAREEGRVDSVLTIETSEGESPSSSSSETSEDAGSLDVETSGSDQEAASVPAAKGDATKAKKKGKSAESCLKCEKRDGKGCMKQKKAQDGTGKKEKQDRNVKDKAKGSKDQKKKKDTSARKDADDTSAAESSEPSSKKVAKKHKRKKTKKPASPAKPEGDPKATDTEQSAVETTDTGHASANATSGAEDTEGQEAGGGAPLEPSAQDMTGKDASTTTHGNEEENTKAVANTGATNEAAKNSDDANWTDSQDAIILSMKDGNEPWAVIGRAIGRGKKEVQKRHGACQESRQRRYC